jgi:CheY-like chemotaxis protein
MQMPEMDGLMLATAIRQRATGQQLPLVMLTSLGHPENRTQAAEIRFAAQLTKPIKASALYDVLINIFTKHLLSRQLTLNQPQIDKNLSERVPLRILLAEDNVVNQKVAVGILKKMGYRADIASNGLEAVEAVNRQRYDVVLMDVQMPEMDGLEATKVICTKFIKEERPYIIAMTAGAMDSDREKCLEAGMNDYISKPVKFDQLQAALERCAVAEVGA